MHSFDSIQAFISSDTSFKSGRHLHNQSGNGIGQLPQLGFRQLLHEAGNSHLHGPDHCQGLRNQLRNFFQSFLGFLFRNFRCQLLLTLLASAEPALWSIVVLFFLSLLVVYLSLSLSFPLFVSLSIFLSPHRSKLYGNKVGTRTPKRQSGGGTGMGTKSEQEP